MKEVLNLMLNAFFERLSKYEFDYMKELKGRDFVHLYDFQKYYLFQSLKRLIALIKAKQYHYWNEKRDLKSWQKQS